MTATDRIDAMLTNAGLCVAEGKSPIIVAADPEDRAHVLRLAEAKGLAVRVLVPSAGRIALAGVNGPTFCTLRAEEALQFYYEIMVRTASNEQALRALERAAADARRAGLSITEIAAAVGVTTL